MSTVETRSAVERIAAFAAAARPEHLTPEIRQLFKRNILDSLGCAIAALPGPPFQALREQFEEYRAPGRCTLIGGGKTSADQAALFNSGLVRYVDLLDSYVSPGGLCHPSDNFGTVLAVGQHSAPDRYQPDSGLRSPRRDSGRHAQALHGIFPSGRCPKPTRCRPSNRKARGTAQRQPRRAYCGRPRIWRRCCERADRIHTGARRRGARPRSPRQGWRRS
jgi:hypothetical protein